MGKQPPELMPPDLPSHVYAYTRIYVCIFTGMQSLNTVALKDYFRALSRRVKGRMLAHSNLMPVLSFSG